MSFENFLLERDGAGAVLTLDRRRVPHALNSSTIDCQRRAVPGLEHDAAAWLVINGANRRLEASFDQRQSVEATAFGPNGSTTGIRWGTLAFLKTGKARVTGR